MSTNWKMVYYYPMPKIKFTKGNKGYKNRPDYKVHRSKKERKALKDSK